MLRLLLDELLVVQVLLSDEFWFALRHFLFDTLERTLSIENVHVLLDQSAFPEWKNQVMLHVSERLLKSNIHKVEPFDQVRFPAILAIQKVIFVLERAFRMRLFVYLRIDHDYNLVGNALWIIFKAAQMRSPQLHVQSNDPQIVTEHGCTNHVNNLRTLVSFQSVDHLVNHYLCLVIQWL